ncbi:unnamed protein product [Sphagnum jensenii]|uniref:Vps52 C-terminal domain-containing protein n=1 Tax=Sphagnum jensenii TaxID=128206 RepID=A0ABP1BGX9_9BRYO
MSGNGFRTLMGGMGIPEPPHQSGIHPNDGNSTHQIPEWRLLDDLLFQLSHMFHQQKQQTVFLIDNYELVLSVLKEAGIDGGKTQQQFEELLKSSSTVFVVREDAAGSSNAQHIRLEEVEALVKNFATRWKGAIDIMHKDVITSSSIFVCGMEILRAALTQLLLYYTCLCDSLKCVGQGPVVPGVGDGVALSKDVVSIPSIMYGIKKYSRTF